MSVYTKEQVSNLVDGKLDWDTTLRMLQMPKDKERFEMYRDVLQSRVSWDDHIILPLGPHLHIVRSTKTGEWITKCDCGHEFGPYDQNWKLNASIFVRDTPETMEEVYPLLMAPDTQWQVYREYYCPDCGVMLDVEAPTPWYPIIHDFSPDIESFYKDWLGLPVPKKGK